MPDERFQPVSSKADFPAMEEAILRFWKENDAFRKSLELRRDAKLFTFYDGPPFATGLPHYGHILAGTIKDVVPRYQTMLGRFVPRRFGWDCHGVPVEHEMEKRLNFKNREDIERFGVKEFCEACRGIVLTHTAEWEKTVERMGRWVDFQNDYKTMDPDYMESILWVFSELWKKGLIYEGEKIVAYSPKLASTLSNFEANLNYKDIDDPAVTVKFELVNEPGTYLLAWTTTPWTLPSNLALAVNPEMKYVKAKPAKIEGEPMVSERNSPEDKAMLVPDPDSPTFILAFEQWRKLSASLQLLMIDEMEGIDLIGQQYEPLFPFFKDHPNAFHILGGDFVSADEGTGIVHLAPAFGEDDARVCQQNDIKPVNPIDKNGYFDDQIPELKGKYFRSDPVVEGSKENNANDWVIQALKDSGKLLKREQIRHSYPHCWRTDCALMYRGVNSFFVNVQRLKSELINKNQEINWIPAHLKDGRFGKMLESAPDWAISRSRYWGAPIPVWKCKSCGEREIAGSVKEIAEKAVKNGEIFVVRHGEGEHNSVGIVSTKIDDNIHLTENGKEEAKRAAESFKDTNIDLIFCSPLLRTRETAEIIKKQKGIAAEIIIDERLRELDAGTMDGKSVNEWHGMYSSSKNRYFENPHQGETNHLVELRVFDFLNELKEKYPEKNILIVSHQTVLRRCLRYFHNIPDHHLYTRNILPTGSVLRFSFSARPENDTGKLDLHRPYIDRIIFPCNKCGGKMKRVPDVLDCWFESGSMPYAQNHFPFAEGDLLLKAVKSDADWQAFHKIIKAEIFDRYHLDIDYDPNHPDIHHPANHPHLIVRGGKAVGAVRLDFLGESRLVIRTFAIRSSEQNKKLGTAALQLIEAYARTNDLTQIVLNANPNAIAFYKKNHYRESFWPGDSGFPDYSAMGKAVDTEEEAISNPSIPQGFPADFIAEGLDQTRGWFYTLHVLANALYDSPAFKNVVVNGIVLAEDGQKMSKSKKNYPDPQIIFDKYGADAMRFYLMNSPVVRADDLRFSEEGVGEVLRKVILPLWNAYSFFVTYARIDEWKPETGELQMTNDEIQIKEVESDREWEEFLDVMWQTLRAKQELPLYTKRDFENGFNLALKKEGKIVGGILLQQHDREGRKLPEGTLFLNRLGVLEKYQKSGYGSSLIEAAESFAQKKGFSKIKLYSVPDADAFYDKNGFYRTGAKKNIHDVECIEFEKDLKTPSPSNKLDAWILAELGALVRDFRAHMDAYELDAACREVPEFLDKLTNFYIRRSRRRFWKSEADDDKNAAFATLYEVLVTIAQVVAPIMPFLSEALWQNLRGQNDRLSVHHCDFPEADAFPDDLQLRQEITLVRDVISLALAIRAKKKIRVRQPLALVKIALPPHLQLSALRENIATVLEEINVKEYEIVADPESLGTRFGKPDARALGPKFGKEVQDIIREAKAGNFVESANGILVGGKWLIDPSTIEIGFLGKEGLDVESANGVVVALQTEIIPALHKEGVAREIIRHLQDMRKEADYDIADRITVAIVGADEIVTLFRELIAAEVLALSIESALHNPDNEKSVEIEGNNITLAVQKK